VRGDAYWGMLRGDGTDIRFELSRSDGFLGPPGTELRLKEFLREMTGLKFEPAYAIVDDLPTLDDDESDEETHDLRECADGVESATVSTATQEVAEEEFVRVLKSILPEVKRALAVDTPGNRELQQCVRDVQELGRARDFSRGLVELQRLTQLAKSALSIAAIATPDDDASNVASKLRAAQATRRQQFEARLTAILPRYNEALDASEAIAGKLKGVMGYVRDEARQQRFVKALVGLDRLEQLLRNPP
jgi:predicted nucleic acid-binding protein